MFETSKQGSTVVVNQYQAQKLVQFAKPITIVLQLFQEFTHIVVAHTVTLLITVTSFTLTLNIKTTYKRLLHSKLRLHIVTMQES